MISWQCRAEFLAWAYPELHAVTGSHRRAMLLLSMSALGSVLIASQHGCNAVAPVNPDVIVIVLDTTRLDRLGSYGNQRSLTPQIDEFAADSVVYERAWSTSSWTLPAHASLLTGRYVTAHGAHMTPATSADSNGPNPARLVDSAVTLAELLQPRGYRTAAFAGAGWLSPEFGLLQGYEIQDAVNNRTLPAREVSDRALHWLAGVREDEPVHMLVNYFDAHWPYEPAAPFDRHARNRPGVELPSLADVIGGIAPSEAQILLMRDRYDGEIEYVDQQVGRLLAGLRQLGRYRDAFIVILADHGELFGEHGEFGHGAWLYEELIRIPLIVHYPRARGRGTRVDAPVSIVDVLTWISQELELELPDQVDGLPVGARDFVLAEETPNHLFVKYRGEALNRNLVAGIRWPWKLVETSRGQRQLYRLDAQQLEQAVEADPRREAEIADAILATRSALVPPPPHPVREISSEALDQLRSLGYAE